MNSRNAISARKLFGDTGASVMYYIIATASAVYGIVLLTGIIPAN